MNEKTTNIGQGDRISAGIQKLFSAELPSYDDGCEYINGLNYYCLMTILSLNSGATMHLDIREKYFYTVNDNIEKINYLLKRLVSAKYYDRAIFQTVYRTIPLIEIHSKRKLVTYEISHFLRLVYAVILELNAYVLQHCRISEFKYWIPHNMSLSVMGRFSSVDDKISQVWDSMKLIGGNDFCFKYLHVFAPDLNRNSFGVYEEKILFNWKSEKNSIRYIERSTKAIILGSSFSYVFYDTCIKFFLGITFYELNVLYNRLVSNDLTRGSWCNAFSDLFNRIILESRFPLDYKYILMDIHKFLILIVAKISQKNNDSQSTTEEFKIIIHRIVDQLTQIGVSIVMESDENSVNTDLWHILFDINYLFGIVIKILDSSSHLNIPMGALWLVY